MIEILAGSISLCFVLNELKSKWLFYREIVLCREKEGSSSVPTYPIFVDTGQVHDFIEPSPALFCLVHCSLKDDTKVSKNLGNSRLSEMLRNYGNEQ